MKNNDHVYAHICYLVDSARKHLKSLNGRANRSNEHSLLAREDLSRAIKILDQLTSENSRGDKI